jgi:hypothetical protein
MWITKQNSQVRPEEAAADSGVVTLSGSSLAAYSGGEWRQLNLYSPGGVAWKPEVGTQVLLLRLGAEGTPCVAGALCTEIDDLNPGEIRLASKGASITLRNDGTIEVQGQLVTKEVGA